MNIQQRFLGFALAVSFVLIHPDLTATELYRYKNSDDIYVISDQRPNDQSYMVLDESGRFQQFIMVEQLPQIKLKPINFFGQDGGIEASDIDQDRKPNVIIEELGSQRLVSVVR